MKQYLKHRCLKTFLLFLQDFERELAEERRRKLEEEEKGATGWMSVEIDKTPVDIAHEEKGPLDEEPALNSGIASALQLGLKKGTTLLRQHNLVLQNILNRSPIFI